MKSNSSFKLKKRILELLSESTVHGVSKIVSARRLFFRIMWILLLIGFSTLCFIFTTKSFIEFFAYETITTMSTIQENSSLFPAVTICNKNNSNFNPKWLNIHFNYKLLTMGKNFESYNDSAYGPCYRFNNGKNLTGHLSDMKISTSPGYLYALDIKLYSKPLGDFEQLLIYIHNQTMTPLTIFNKGFFITSGSTNYFLIKRFFEQKLPHPYNDCYEDLSLFPLNKTLIQFIQSKNITYTKNECFRLCENLNYIKDYMAKCECPLQNLDDNLFVACNLRSENKTKKDCVSKLFLSFEENKEEKCSEYCPTECNSFSYDVMHYTEKLPSQGNISDKNFKFKKFNFKTYEYISRSYFEILVYYDELKYTLSSQRPKTEIFDFISNVGGIFGLFLGMGLMSFMEILEIILEAIFFLAIQFRSCLKQGTNSSKP